MSNSNFSSQYSQQFSPMVRSNRPNYNRELLLSDTFDNFPSLNHSQSPTNESKTLFDFIKVIIKRKNIILFMVVCGIALAFMYIAFSARLYSAVATIRIDTYLPVMPGTAREDVLRQQTVEESYFATQVADLNSLPLADQVLSVPAIHNSLVELYGEGKNGFGLVKSATSTGEYGHSSKALKKYLGMLKIAPVRETSLVKITSTTAAPEFAALLANTHAQEFINRTKNERKLEDTDNIEFLEIQQKDLSKKLLVAEETLAQYAKAHALVSMEEDDKLSINQVDSISRLYENSVAKKIEAENRFNEAKTAASSGSTGVDDNSIIELRQQYSIVKAKYVELGQRFTSEYPKMRELRARLKSLQDEIQSQRVQSLRSLESDFLAAQKVEIQLKEQLDKQRHDAFEIARAQVEYDRMKRDYESLRDLQHSVLKQLQQTKLSSGGNGKANIVLVEPAAIPDGPSSPKPLIALALAISLGSFIGIVIALLMESLDTTIKTPDELENISRAPGLGLIPHFDQEATAPNPALGFNSSVPAVLQYPLVTITKPFSLSSEAFRTIRAGVRLSSVDKPVEVILVTSSDEGEGKSTIVSNLGVVCAQDSARTILIDGDLRRPSLYSFFGLNENDAGLAEVLTGQCTLEEAVKHTNIDRLSILPAGSAVPNPAELVGSMKMLNLIEHLREQYDYIIIDTPPIMPVADSLVLSRAADGVIVVTRANKTIRKNARASITRLIEGGCRILGVVLNDMPAINGKGNKVYFSKDRVNPRLAEDNWKKERDNNIRAA
jgi:polysaccharide biosynthesis transport protein